MAGPMSRDSKKSPSFDAPPENTPPLLQRELELNRRQGRTASSVAEAVTDPMMPRVATPEDVTVIVQLQTTPPGLKARAPTAPLRAPRPEVAAEAPSTPAVEDVVAEPAALWRRIGAWLTDLTVICTIGFAFLLLATMTIAAQNSSLSQQIVSIALPGAALTSLFALVYTVLFAVLWSGRTPGRRLMAIHLVDGSGHAPGLFRSIARAGLSLLSFGLFLSGFWLALFDRHGQTLHDKLTGTYVVKLKAGHV